MLSEDRDISYRYMFVLMALFSDIYRDDLLRVGVLVEGWLYDTLTLLSVVALYLTSRPVLRSLH